MSERKKAVNFEDMEVFKRAYKISLDVHRQTLSFPKLEQFALADQLRRATKSICANLAEGYGRQKRSKAEFRRFVVIALGSSDETRVWLRYAKDLGYIETETWEKWREEYKIVSKMLQALLNNI